MTTPTAPDSVKNADIVQETLNRLHDTSGLSWRDIALLPEYSGIPAGTLCSIAKGAEVPNCHRKQLGLPELKPAPACRACGVVHVKPCPKRKPNLNRSLWQMTERERLLALYYRR